MRKRLQDSIGLCLLGLLLIGCFAPVVMGRASLLTSPVTPGVLPTGPYGYDGRKVKSLYVIDPGASAWQGEPWVKLAGSQLREGRVPLWNSYNGFGEPLAANMQSGVFFPGHWLLFLSSDPWTWNLFLLLRLYVAGAFTYLYLRLVGVAVLPAMVGAIALMLSGHFVLFVNMMHLNVEVLLPIVMYLTERLIRSRTQGSVMLLGAGLTLTVLGGMPESTLFLWSFATLYFIVRVAVLGVRLGKGVSTLLRLFPLMGSAVLMAFGLTAVQLLPFVEYLSQGWTAHSVGVGLSGNTLSSAISLVVPYFFNQLRGGWGSVHSHAAIAHIGIMPILLATLAFPARGRLRGIAFFCAAYAIVGVLKAHAFPAVNWIGYIPPFDRAIFPKYNQPEVAFAVAVLAGMGAHNVLRAGREGTIRRVILAAAILALAMGAFLGLWWSTVVGTGAVRWVTKQMWLAGLTLSIGVVLLCWVLVLRPAWRPLTVAALVVVLGLEMYLHIPKDRPSKYEAAATPPFVEFLRTWCLPGECRVYGLDSILFPNWSAVFRLADVRTLDGMHIDRLLRFSSVFLGNREGDRFTGGTSREFRPNQFFGFSNVRYLLAREALTDESFIDVVLLHGDKRAEPSFVGKSRFTIDGVGKVVLSAHPPAEIVYPFVVPTDGAVLRFSLGIEPTAWSPSKGDGIEFEVEVVSEGGQFNLFRRYYDPKNRELDRRWVDGEVDLFPFRGQHIQLRLITRPGYDNAFDWGGWGDLRLEPVDADVRQPTWPTLVYDREVKIYENRSVMPRAFVVYGAEVIQEEQAIIERLRSPGFDPRRTVILEGDDAAERLHGLESDAPEGPTARILSYLSDRIELTVETTRPGVLVVLDAYYPGWRVSVNGQPARIYQANYLFRGVLLEAGKNEVRFDYSPWSFRIGLWVSGGTLIVIGAAIALSRARQHGREPIV